MTEAKRLHSRPTSPIGEGCDLKRFKKEGLLQNETRVLLLKQLEYYFSDENLKTDSFFQNLMRSDSRNRLLVSYLLKCSRIKKLGITKEEEIEEALIGHEMISVERDQENERLMIKLNKELPKLEPKKKIREGNSFSTGKDLHLGGCILKLVNLPENVSWLSVKDTLKSQLSKLIDNNQSLIRYVSQTTQDGTCFILLKPFKNDQILLKNLVLIFDDLEVPILLVDQEEARKVINSVLPKHIQREREKELNKQKMTFSSLPIIIGGQTFASIEHLRRCLKEVLEQSEIDTVFDGNSLTYQVLSSILEYHPRHSEKTQGMYSICIRNHQSLPKEDSSKCFFIMKKTSDGTEEIEDFSVNKCLQQLSRNPPLATKTDAKEDEKILRKGENTSKLDNF